MLNYYEHFINLYAQRSATLRNLLSKDVPFQWSKEQEKAFKDLKSVLLLPHLLRFSDSSRPYHLETDASLDGTSYILGQTDDKGHKYVISYGVDGCVLAKRNGRLFNWSANWHSRVQRLLSRCPFCRLYWSHQFKIFGIFTNISSQSICAVGVGFATI